MPLVFMHLQRGRSNEALRAVIDAVHRSVVEGFEVPESDRYQVVTQHDPEEVVVLDTGLGIERSPAVIIVHVVSRRRAPDKKQAFYRLLAQNLERQCGIAASDVIATVTENGDDDWSFGHGEAQFLTGVLQ